MVEIRCCDDGIDLRPLGDLCHFRLDPLRSAFDAAVACAEREVRIDLRDVTLGSSAAVSFFLEADIACDARELTLVLIGVRGMNRRVLTLLGADHLIEQTPLLN